MGKHYVVIYTDIADGDMTLYVKGVFHDFPHAKACFDVAAQEVRNIADKEDLVIDDSYFSEMEPQLTAYEEGYSSENCVNARIVEVVDNLSTSEF